MAGQLHYQEHDIDEVFEYFAAAFNAPEGMAIRNVKPHYDPRKGTVIFAMYLEPTEDAPAADTPTSDL